MGSPPKEPGSPHEDKGVPKAMKRVEQCLAKVEHVEGAVNAVLATRLSEVVKELGNVGPKTEEEGDDVEAVDGDHLLGLLAVTLGVAASALGHFCGIPDGEDGEDRAGDDAAEEGEDIEKPDSGVGVGVDVDHLKAAVCAALLDQLQRVPIVGENPKNLKEDGHDNRDGSNEGEIPIQKREGDH